MRLFVAITPPAEVRAEVVATACRWLGNGEALRLLTADRLHLTLAFLGELTTGELSELRRRLESAARSVAAFELRTTAWGRFPRRGRPRVYWLGIEPCEGLDELVQRVRTHLVDFAPDLEGQEFHPHLTVARVRRRRQRRLPEVPDEASEPWSWPVRSAELIESRLGDGPARYHLVDRCSLL